MKKDKTYQEYLDEQKERHDRIMAKHGAPEGAKPPMDQRSDPRTHDTQFRAMAFTKRRTLEGWPRIKDNV